MGKASISFLFCWILAGALSAQPTKASKAPFEYIFRNIDNTRGLISSDVTSLVQDARGFMWLGTEKGLQRYDGERFVNCMYADSTVDDNMPVYSVFADEPQKRILYNQVGTHINQWETLLNRASAILPAKVLRPADCDHYTDSAGRTWLLQEYYKNTATRSGAKPCILVVKAPKAGKPVSGPARQPGGVGAPEYFFASFVRDSVAGQLWVWDRYYGLMMFDEASKKMSAGFSNPTHQPLLNAFNDGGVRGIRGDSHGNIWVFTWGADFYRWHSPSHSLHHYSLKDILQIQGASTTIPSWVAAILEDDHGALWMATAKAGLLRYDYEKDEFLYILHSPGNNQALQYNHQLNDLYQDRQGNIWIGSDMGISIFNPYAQYFVTNARAGTGPAPLTETEINTVGLTRGGQLLVGNWGTGITIYDSVLHKKDHILFKGDMHANLVWSIIQQDDGSVWAGCQGGEVHVIDTATWKYISSYPPEAGHSTIRCMVRTPEGNTLLGMHNGKIATWDAHARKFLGFEGAVPLFTAMGQRLNPVVTMYIDRQARCWAGTWKGINEFDIRKRMYVRQSSPPGLNPSHVLGITDYNDSTLIIGLENAGLYFYYKPGDRWEKIPVNLEQPLWSANAVRLDAEGNIWFTTDYEICVYHPSDHRFFSCHPEKGQMNSAFNALQILALPSGKWLTWSYIELAIFDPVAIRNLQGRSANPTITGFSVFGRPYSIDSLTAQHAPVRLGYKENFFDIQFSDLQFSAITQTKYYYRLVGIDKDWVYGGTVGYAGYTNIPPGKYTFEVRTGNTSRKDAISKLEIVIPAPFWATGWFIGLVIAFAAAIIFILVRLRIRHIQSEGNMKQQMAQTEMMALRAQMNPHFIFNCINSIDALIQCNDKYHATVYLNKFARLIRNILDSSRTHTIPLTRDLETLRLYIDLEQFRGEDSFVVEIHTDQGLLLDDYKVPPLIIQPYVENAILHGLRHRKGGHGKLMIDVSKKGEHLVYRIEDNGVGRLAARQDREHQSYGMEMSRDRVSLFNRGEGAGAPAPVVIIDLYENGEPSGTRVEVSLKIQ